MKRKFTFLLAVSYFLGYAQESKTLHDLKIKSDAIVTINQSTANPSFIRFQNPSGLALKSSSARAQASEFVQNHFAALNLKSANDLKFVAEKTDSYGLKQIVFQQEFKGVPLYDGKVKFTFNKNENLSTINGNVITNIKVNATPQLSKEAAGKIAVKLVEAQKPKRSLVPLEVGKNTLYIFPKGLAQRESLTSYLVYEVEVRNQNDIREYLFIDAHTGELVEQFTGIHNIERELFETNMNSSNLKWKEGDALPGTLDIWQQNEVITSEHVYNFFKNAFGYVSFNGADKKMITINNNPNISCPNANWNGTSANYCTGTASDDVVAHEWGHAYTEYTSELIYAYQSGALNESFSDVWGETIDLLNNYEDDGENLNIRTGNTCSESLRWKMGEDASAFGNPIRDLWNPNCNGNPSMVNGTSYYCGTGDSGGVHINSGVPNRLYSLLVDGGTFNGKTVQSIGFVKAAHLWWRAQSTYLNRTSDFADFADALEASLQDLMGVNLQGLSTSSTPAGLSGQMFTSADVANLQAALESVRLRVSPVTYCNYQPLLNGVPTICENAYEGAIFSENWENGMGGWTVSNVPVQASSWEQRDWVITGTLPGARAGKGIFGADPINGDCVQDLQNGVLQLESPTISIPNYTDGRYEMAFNHYVATERDYDGGNIKYSLNGGNWTLLPQSAFITNGYNRTLANAGNDNPLRNQRAFTGTDGGSNKGSWGTSVVNLQSIGATSNSTIKFRFEMGTDGCNGNDGWYIDEIYVYNCSTLQVQNVDGNTTFKVFPNPTSGIVNIQSKKGASSAELFTLSGQLVKKFDLSKSTYKQVDLTQFEKGVYMLKVSNGTETSTVKIIKK